MRRFTDTDKWRDPWFRKLPSLYKTIWEFLRDNVDNAGFWKVDLEAARFFINEEFDPKKTLAYLNEGKTRVIDYGEYWEITDFVVFQNGILTPTCKPHRQIINLLEKYKTKGYGKGIERVQDKDKEKDKEIKEGGVGETLPEPPPGLNQLELFTQFFENYPNKVKRSRALAIFCETVVSRDIASRIQKALEVYKRHLDANPWKQPQEAHRWLEEWPDWENYVEPERRESAEDRDNRIIAKLKGQ